MTKLLVVREIECGELMCEQCGYIRHDEHTSAAYCNLFDEKLVSAGDDGLDDFYRLVRCDDSEMRCRENDLVEC